MSTRLRTDQCQYDNKNRLGRPQWFLVLHVDVRENSSALCLLTGLPSKRLVAVVDVDTSSLYRHRLVIDGGFFLHV